MGFVELIRQDGSSQFMGEPRISDILKDFEWCDKCRSWQGKAFGRDFEDKLWFCEACK